MSFKFGKLATDGGLGHVVRLAPCQLRIRNRGSKEARKPGSQGPKPCCCAKVLLAFVCCKY
jgi:hypothetical protein